MGFPESVLTTDETVVSHQHPHWKALVRPVLVLLVSIAVVLAALVYTPTSWGTTGVYAVGGLAVVVFFPLVLWPWLRWRTTHYVFTTERVILREGIFSRQGRDIPIGRINDVSFSHNLLERMLGCGTLTIESAGERGQVVLADLPRVERIQSELYELVEADRARHTFDDSDRDAIVRNLTDRTDRRER